MHRFVYKVCAANDFYLKEAKELPKNNGDDLILTELWFIEGELCCENALR